MSKIYYWRGKQNAGDRLTPWIIQRLQQPLVIREPEDADLVVIGSILEHLPSQWEGTVCGAGLLRSTTRVDLTKANVVALRGYLTAANADFYGEPVFGDPGLLAPRFVSSSVAKYDLGVVPHWSDNELASRFPYAKLIDPNILGPEEFVRAISECKRIVSSSLHGVIIADAYGIPRQAEIFAQAATEGGDFKFRDYASVYDTHPHFGEMWTAPAHSVRRIQNELWRVLLDVLGIMEGAHHVPHPPRRRCYERPEISILVPFRDDGEHRSRTWHWLERFWRYHLPEAEVIVGHDDSHVFNKSRAINDAASRARGRVFVVADADAWIEPATIRLAAAKILDALRHGRKLWFVPYTNLYRLNKHITLELLASHPNDDPRIPSPPPASWLDNSAPSPYVGHQYGAMMQIMPREAFYAIHGWDERFAGWGGDDVSALHALDTLYAPHELIPGDILHLWHERIGDGWSGRRWVGQRGLANSRLNQRFAHAAGEKAFMQGLVDERPRPAEWRPPWFVRLWEGMQ